jgi:hypothetical protein
MPVPPTPAKMGQRNRTHRRSEGHRSRLLYRFAPTDMEVMVNLGGYRTRSTSGVHHPSSSSLIFGQGRDGSVHAGGHCYLRLYNTHVTQDLGRIEGKDCRVEDLSYNRPINNAQGGGRMEPVTSSSMVSRYWYVWPSPATINV